MLFERGLSIHGIDVLPCSTELIGSETPFKSVEIPRLAFLLACVSGTVEFGLSVDRYTCNSSFFFISFFISSFTNKMCLP